MTDESVAIPIAVAHEPRFFDTYALVYAFILAFLIPGLALMSTLPYRTYTLQYVLALVGPLMLGLIATFVTDSTDQWRRVALRSAVLIPPVILTGVTVLFACSLSVVPISQLLKPGSGAATRPIILVLLAVLAAPLVFALVQRLRRRPNWRALAQILVLVIALGAAAWFGYLTFGTPGTLDGIARKDVTNFAAGALMWYLPSFGIAAGAWRSVGLV